MTRLLIIEFLLFVLLFNNINGHNISEYISVNERFPCLTEKMQSREVPTSVHALRPNDMD
jgi:hypothetical protein